MAMFGSQKVLISQDFSSNIVMANPYLIVKERRDTKDQGLIQVRWVAHIACNCDKMP